MTSLISKGVTQNKPIIKQVHNDTKHISTGVILSSQIQSYTYRDVQQRIIIYKNMPTMVKTFYLNRGYIKQLNVSSVKSVSSDDTLYTIGVYADTFRPLFEPSTLNNLQKRCVNRFIPGNCCIACKITTKNLKKTTDIGSITITAEISKIKIK